MSIEGEGKVIVFLSMFPRRPAGDLNRAPDIHKIGSRMMSGQFHTPTTSSALSKPSAPIQNGPQSRARCTGGENNPSRIPIIHFMPSPFTDRSGLVCM